MLRPPRPGHGRHQNRAPRPDKLNDAKDNIRLVIDEAEGSGDAGGAAGTHLVDTHPTDGARYHGNHYHGGGYHGGGYHGGGYHGGGGHGRR